MITVVHERTLSISLAAAGPLIDGLGSPDDMLWPRGRWPAIRFAGGLAPGVAGSHGPIAYLVEAYEPGRSLRLRFTKPAGFDGMHEFDLAAADAGQVRLRHTIVMETHGAARLTWPLAFRCLDAALMEDLLDRAEGFACNRKPVPRRWSLRVRVIRRIMARRSGGRARDAGRPLT